MAEVVEHDLVIDFEEDGDRMLIWMGCWKCPTDGWNWISDSEHPEMVCDGLLAFHVHEKEA